MASITISLSSTDVPVVSVRQLLSDDDRQYFSVRVGDFAFMSAHYDAEALETARMFAAAFTDAADRLDAVLKAHAQPMLPTEQPLIAEVADEA